MKTIWKFHLPMIGDVVDVEMPQGADILHVAEQPGQDVQLWALVDPQSPKTKRRFRIAGTGHPIDANAAVAAWHVGTFFIHEGTLVFHVFDLGELPSPVTNDE